MKISPTSLLRRQRGAALIISLLMLILMTMIGVTAMRTTTLEEKMAGNMYDRNLAFQAAETTLRSAEQEFIEGLVNTHDFDGTGGLYGTDDSEPGNLFDSSYWTSTSSRAYSGTLTQVNTAPRYLAKVVKTRKLDKEGGLNIEGYGSKKPGSRIVVFRITARSTGGSNNSQVILRSHYGKIF
jgi:type IV pilus assembly protein PilX